MNRLTKISLKLSVISFFTVPCSIAGQKYEWKLGVVTAEISEGGAGSSTRDSLVDYFKDKDIHLTDHLLQVKDLYSCEIIHERKTPISYWGSEKTVDLYKIFFGKYNIEMPKIINIVTPVNPNSECEFPFSEFIVANDILSFVYENHMALYFNRQDGNKNNETVTKIVESKEERCVSSSDSNLNDVFINGSTLSCFYPNESIQKVYKDFYLNNKNSEDFKHLRMNVALKSSVKDLISKDVSIDYKSITDSDLEIIIDQPGGTIMLNFSKHNGGTLFENSSTPD